MVREVPLTQGYVALVDDEDYDRVAQFRWHIARSRGRVYATRGYRLSGRRYDVLMHRFLLSTPEGFETDHIDGDSLNNQRGNLRICSPSSNQANRGKPSNNRSGFKGVYWAPQRGRWRSVIRVNGRLRHLGYFESPEEAARAYDRSAYAAWGEFAHLNLPDELKTEAAA
jgi:hypothetical protein